MTALKSNAEFVSEFNAAFNKRKGLDEANVKLAFGLIEEEVREVYDELLYFDTDYREKVNDPIDKQKLAKELADLLYVVYFAADVFSIPIDAVFKEVHRSNMSKLGRDGKPIVREDGKVLKGPDYTPADLTGIVNG